MNPHILVRTCLGGGLFALLVFWHFFADWVFQSEKEALAKAENFWVRYRHVCTYTTLFVPFFWFVGFWNALTGVALCFLWLTHFFIDTYWPVKMWAKYLRRADQFKHVVTTTLTKEQYEQFLSPGGLKTLLHSGTVSLDDVKYPSDKEALRAMFATPTGAILCITIDQLCHIACLLPVVWLMMGR